jgi:small GTP-binding protein
MNNIKIVLLGDSSVGKTSLVERFVHNTFTQFSEATIGAAFKTKVFDSIKLDIWDTAGQERYRSLAPMYYRGAKAALVVYDITNKNSFKNAKLWINELRINSKPNCLIILVGNKSDLQNREVKSEDAIKFCNKNDIFFKETSAKDAYNIEQIFYIITNNYVKEPISDINNIDLITNNKKKVERKCC